MTDAVYLLRIGGKWLDLEDVDPGIGYATERPTSESVALDGTRRVQSAARAARTWSFGLSVASPEAVRWLTLAAQGYVGDVWLYDVAAAQVNMLDPRDIVGRDAAQPLLTVDTVPMLSFAAGYTLTRALRQGLAYHFSGWTSQTAAATLGTYDIGAGVVNIVAPPGTGSRRFSTSFIPAADVDAEIIVTVAGKTAGLRLTESSVDAVNVMPGMNTPCQVSVADPDQLLNFVYTNRLSLSDYAVTLREVG